MGVRSRCLLLLPALLATLALLAVALPAAPAQAQALTPKIRAWDIKADFTGPTPVVLFTVYDLMGTPPAVVRSTTQDIWKRCKILGTGTIRFVGGRAVFDGDSYIRCEIPAPVFGANDCAAGAAAPFFFSVRGTFEPTASGNPILVTSDRSFSFSVPGNGTQMRTRVEFPAHAYESDAWPRDAGGNQVLIGQDGPTMITVSNTLGFLSFLDPTWQGFFQHVDKARVGSWMTSAGGTKTSTTPAVGLPFQPAASHVYIGHNPHTGVTLKGALTYVEGDPPGCTGK